MYRPSGYNRIFCVAVSTELRCFEMRSLSVACCACARIPDGALGKINAARKHRALAGYKREGAICICKTINFLTKSFITNEQYETRNADWCYITLCTHACQYIFLLEFLMNNLFPCCNDYSRGLAGHMRPVTSAVRPASAQCCWLCHLSSDGLEKSERYRSQKIYRSSEENRSKWVLFRIAIYRSSGYNLIFCPAVSVELPGVLMFWNPMGART